ncbi:NusA-like transcription termination signal-binding factor [Halobacteriales archaeon QH_8_64_26]|nr:MAG: NusA-like transcription termination signal-binding factor [Halobacteriales archaeon QH_8_64_26]
MRVTLSDDARRRIAAFEEMTGVSATDCLAFDSAEAGSRADSNGDEDDQRLVFLVPAGEMAGAIGPDGRTVRSVERKLGADIALVEDADTAEAFVASALAPAAVYNVTISENDSTIAYAEVDPADTGVAIGKSGRNIETARQLAKRHFDIDDIQLA